MPEHWTFENLPPGEPVLGETYRADGWAYVETPHRLSPDEWAQVLATIGEGNYVVLAMSQGTCPFAGTPFARGQLLVNPDGWQNMEAARRPHA